MSNILVTGASGFVGAAMVQRMVSDGRHSVTAAVRDGHPPFPSPVAVHRGMTLAADTDWRAALANQHGVVHAAARVHVMQDALHDPLAAYRQVNVQGTLRLARQAAAAGIKRFVFISSIKVNGESTLKGMPFTEESIPAPVDAYGVSKKEAEEGLRQIEAETGMDVVIIRPPLVYGPHVRANFRALLQAIAKGWPLPLASIRNQRSLVALDNLTDFIVTCIDSPVAARQTFLVSDGEDVSTPELARRVGHALSRPARLFPVPVWLLRSGATLVGKGPAAQRLCGDLQVDISKARKLVGWTPRVNLDEALKPTAHAFIHNTSA
jgi:nucleoside-diphosphate-sugar epimerase